ncbi:hypothetical protein HMPREF9123_0664 [Neisseria bacilliformis ATCC BAA-1200]|uniref:Uncharacterized protein n=1 Tax=Neisseria bacilliformis ATCC BAA-1200 TaxID=888742 RepID=F2BA88_9NEIS|nr:hypothetical protein HMPREF9123_0664 [Neisseria bacilliformis ATCC BAA-1200]
MVADGGFFQIGEHGFLLGGGRAADVFQTAFCVGKTDGGRLKNADAVRAAGLFGRRNAFFWRNGV